MVNSANDFEFTGLYLSNNQQTGNNIYSLHILDKTSNNVSVPKDSLLKFDPNTIKITNNTSLHDVIYANSSNQITINANEFVGHLTGNVSGDVLGNASTATNATYANAIGTNANHPQIGSNNKPVYVDANGKIVPIDVSKGNYTRMTYMDHGEVKEGAKINIYNRAPIDGQDAGNEGDIWFQYV